MKRASDRSMRSNYLIEMIDAADEMRDEIRWNEHGRDAGFSRSARQARLALGPTE